MLEFFISALLAVIVWTMWIKKQPIPNNTGAKTGTTTPTIQPSVPPSNKIKTALTKWWGWILCGVVVAYGLYLIPYGQGWKWITDLPYGVIPLWVYPTALLILAVLVAAMQDGKTGSEKLKKLAELFGAFAKLGLGLAGIAALFIIIIGPKMFWKGDYSYTPPPTPSGAAQAAPAVPAAPVVPQSRTITIPVGDLNAPLKKWSEEVSVVPGWNFRCELRPMGKMGVLVDGEQKVVSEPGRDTSTHATKSLRFVSLTGAPLQMRVDYFR